jgi:predicted transcriptional regulator
MASRGQRNGVRAAMMEVTMSESLRDELLERALRLPERDRITLARQLLQSVEHFDLIEEQRAELDEAMAEIDRGEYVPEDVILRDLSIPE